MRLKRQNSWVWDCVPPVCEVWASPSHRLWVPSFNVVIDNLPRLPHRIAFLISGVMFVPSLRCGERRGEQCAVYHDLASGWRATYQWPWVTPSFSSLVFKMEIMIIDLKNPVCSSCSVNVFREKLLLDVYPRYDIFDRILPNGLHHGFGPDG